MTTLPSRWPPKPPKDTRCDATVGCGLDSLGSPVLYRCQNLAVETVWCFGSVSPEMWLCTSCVPKLVDNVRVFRNPRKSH